MIIILKTKEMDAMYAKKTWTYAGLNVSPRQQTNLISDKHRNLLISIKQDYKKVPAVVVTLTLNGHRNLRFNMHNLKVIKRDPGYGVFLAEWNKKKRFDLPRTSLTNKTDFPLCFFISPRWIFFTLQLLFSAFGRPTVPGSPTASKYMFNAR